MSTVPASGRFFALSMAQIDDFVSDIDGLRLIRAFMRIDNAALRRRIVMLVQGEACLGSPIVPQGNRGWGGTRKLSRAHKSNQCPAFCGKVLGQCLIRGRASILS